MGFPGESVVKHPPANGENMGSILWSGRLPGEGNGSPLQYSCLGNPIHSGAWQVRAGCRVKHDLVTKLPSPYNI